MRQAPDQSSDPTLEVLDCEAVFDFDAPWPVQRFNKPDDHVPEVDESFRFVEKVARPILAGFMHNRRVYVHGPHGSGKSSHIEQIAARLNWGCVRVNLDGHVTRADLVGRDMIVLRDGQQVTEFVPGILVWALERPVAVIFDEFDAGRPDVMFVIQRVLESDGKLTLLDQNRVITPHPYFRLFATANTAGQGDSSGLYAGTQALNQAQMDRWQMIVELGYLPESQELEILRSRVPAMDAELGRRMVRLAGLSRAAFKQGDLSSFLSLRTLIIWAENTILGESPADAFRLSFLNRSDPVERQLLAEFYQRCFDQELPLEDDGVALY